MFRLFFAAVMMIAIPVEAQVQRYDRETVRTQLLKIVDGIPAQTIRVEGQPSGEREAKFIEHYVNKVQPAMAKLLSLHQQWSALNVLIDTGTFNDEEEKKLWRGQFAEISNQLSKITVDPVYNSDIKIWGELAEGLTGELASYARRFAKENELSRFSEDMEPVLNEIEVLLQDYKQAIIASPAAARISEFQKLTVEIPRLFKFGEISLDEAMKRITEISRQAGGRFVGFEAAQARGDALNRMAILRTKLAQSKNYRTWAEYQLEATGQGYSPEYRGVAKQKEFLRNWIDQLQPVVTRFIDRRIRELKIDPREFRRQHLSLLTLPDLMLAQTYFPPEKLTDIWNKLCSRVASSQKLLLKSSSTIKNVKGSKIPQWPTWPEL